MNEFTIEYTNCNTSAPTGSFADLDSSLYNYRINGGNGSFAPPSWQYFPDPANADVSLRERCTLQFSLPTDLQPPVFMYYKLTNYYQNHRRYVKSYNSDQLKGDAVDYSTVQGGDCKPADVIGDRIIYPCGLIANSVFNGEPDPCVYHSITST